YQITANMQGDDVEQLAQQIASNPVTRGLQGPTLAPIYAPNGESNKRWHTLTIIVESDKLLPAVEHLRSIGGTQTSAIPIRYVFMEECPTDRRLLQQIETCIQLSLDFTQHAIYSAALILPFGAHY